MKLRLLWKTAAILAALPLLALLVAGSGLIPIKASSGHWPVTAWFLHFSMRRSIAVHSLAAPAPPPLDDPALILKGAAHYEGGCKPCHGAPDSWRPRIPQEMTPHPPNLVERTAGWKPRELFYVVKHGVKLTGMPAWPAREREDEVWALTAFLLALPELDAAEYRRLAQGDQAAATAEPPAPEVAALGETATAPRAVAESCARCHGADGRGRGEGAFPRLDGQSPRYLYAALRAYARGERASGIMEPVATGLDEPTMRALARHYGGFPPGGPAPEDERSTVATPPPGLEPRHGSAGSSGPGATRADEEALRRGEEIARRGIPRQGVPSCADCHGPGPGPRNPHYPSLAGQYPDYLVLQLELFHRGHRGGSPYAHLMQSVAPRLEPDQMRDVALYYASLPRQRSPRD